VHSVVDARVSSIRNQPTALKTGVGWVLIGPDELMPSNKDSYLCLSCCDAGRLNDKMQQLFEQDFCEKSANNEFPLSVEDKLFLSKVDGSVTKLNGHYQFALPWRQECVTLTNNHVVAERRPENEDNWLPRPAVLPPLPISDPEIKAKDVSAMALAEGPPFNRLITCYSSWSKLVRAIAWVKRFQHFLLKKLAKKTFLDPETGFLSVEELQQATMYVIRNVQNDIFKAVKAKLTDFEEYPCLSRVGSSFGKCCPSSLRKSRPIIVQGVLRVGGRLQNSGLSVDQRHPAILPARHHVSGLIVQFYHVQQGHCGTQSMLSATREKFWIVKGNSSVRHYLKECRQCRRYKQQACKQLMAPLPKCRVTSGTVACAENFHGGFQSAKIFLCTKIESMTRKNIKQAAVQYVNVVKQLSTHI